MFGVRLRIRYPDVLVSDVCGALIWIVSRDNELHIIDSANDEEPPIEIHLPDLRGLVPELSVCPDNEKCAIVTSQSSGFFCERKMKRVTNIPPSRIGLPSCGTWTLNESGEYRFLLGMRNGFVLDVAFPCDEGLSLTPVLCDAHLPVKRILCATGNVNVLSLVLLNQVKTVGGKESISEMMALGTNPVVFGIDFASEDVTRCVRLEVMGESYRVYVLCAQIIIVLEPSASDPNRLIQDDYLVGACRTFLNVECGIFVAYEDKVVFMSRFMKTEWSAKVQIVGTERMFRSGERIWFETRSGFYYISLPLFLEHAAEEAERAGDYKFLVNVLKSGEALKRAFVQLIGSDGPEIAIKKILATGRSIQDVVFCFMDNSEILIGYLEVRLRRRGRARLRKGLASLCFSVYVHDFPRWKDRLLSFIDTYSALLDSKQVTGMLEKVGFVEGMERYDVAMNYSPALLVRHIDRHETERALQILPSINSISTVVNTLLLLASRGEKQSVIDYIKTHKVDQGRLIPVFCVVPEAAAEMVRSKFLNRKFIPLVAFCLCLQRNEDKLISAVLSCALPTEVALRFARQFRLCTAVSRLLIELGKVEEAIEVGLSVSSDHAISLLESSGMNVGMRKRGWYKLLTLMNGTKRTEMFQKVMTLNLFDFPDLVDLIPDDDCLWSYHNFIIEYAENEQRESEIVSFEAPAWKPDKRAVHLGDDSVCELCMHRVMGSEFRRFPCGHLFHD